MKEILVKKRQGFNTDSINLTKELQDGGLLDGSVEILRRYVTEGLSDKEFKDSIYKVFADVNADDVFMDFASATEGKAYLITELLPGQFDMRANAAEECLRLICGNFQAKVRYQNVLVFDRELTADSREKLIKRLINPVEMRLGEVSLNFTDESHEKTMPIRYQGFKDLTEEGLKAFHEDQDLAMSLEDLVCVRDYFKSEDRDPTETEMKVLDTYWSDHCRHTTFNTHLTQVTFEEGTREEKAAFDAYQNLKKDLGRQDRAMTMMEMATIGTKALKKAGLAQDLDESEEINACSIIRQVETKAGKKPMIIQFKNETHNHPTEIEPFGGAATCLGGAIRDPLAGRAYVYQAMRVTGAKDPTEAPEKTLEGKLPQATISKEAARGYSSYGNQIGLAAGVVHEVYHPGFVAKRMEVGAVIGCAPVDAVDRRVPEPGDVIVLAGGRTGRDGVGGATGSSKSHDTSSMESSGAEVQKGNAPSERKLQRLMRKDEARRLIKRCNDFGAGGVSVAVGEIADGLVVDLDKVPLKYAGLTATETAVSESQERMAFCLNESDWQEFKGYLDEENIEGTIIATVTEDPRLIMTWQGEKVVNLSRDFLDSAGATQKQTVNVTASDQALPAESDFSVAKLEEKLSDLNHQNQRSLHEMFDSTNGCATVTLPYGGRLQRTEANHMAALIPVDDEVSTDASLMTFGYNPYLAQADPFKGAYYAVLESLAKLAAAGGGIKDSYLSFQEYFEKLGQDPAKWGLPVKALLGALKAQLEFKAPAIGGKDSMSGTFNDLSVPPSLLSFAVNTMASDKILQNVLTGQGDLYQLVCQSPALEEAEEFLAMADFICQANDMGYLTAADACHQGAILTLINMAYGNQAGFQVDLAGPFDYAPQNFLLEVASDKSQALENLAQDLGVSLAKIGRSDLTGDLTINGESYSLEKAWNLANQRLAPVFKENKKEGETLAELAFEGSPLILPESLTHAKPRALITVFPGTNCEYDVQRAFRSAGAETEIFVLKNRDVKELTESIRDLAERIQQSQIVMLPGGFSAGDEPDGSGKFIANVFRNSQVEKAVANLLDERLGLMLGICNGFQALVRLGLLTEGRIVEPREDFPLLTVNTIGRHVDSIVKVRVASNASPWLKYVKPGQVYDVPVSHGEGRFMADEALLKELMDQGRIITQYCDEQGRATMAAPFNPNGSTLAIEGITSPDGRVLGKMGHNERWQPGLFRNYQGNFDMKLFQAGVDYFTGK